MSANRPWKRGVYPSTLDEGAVSLARLPLLSHHHHHHASACASFGLQMCYPVLGIWSIHSELTMAKKTS